MSARRHNFSFGGFMTGVGLSAACAAGLLLLKQWTWSIGEGGWLPWAEFVSISSLCLLCGVWFGWSSNRTLAIEGLRLARRLRRGQWFKVFGFACTSAATGFLLGAALSFPKWFYLDQNEALLHFWSLSGGAAIIGFVGGLGAQFVPRHKRAI